VAETRRLLQCRKLASWLASVCTRAHIGAAGLMANNGAYVGSRTDGQSRYPHYGAGPARGVELVIAPPNPLASSKAQLFFCLLSFRRINIEIAYCSVSASISADHPPCDFSHRPNNHPVHSAGKYPAPAPCPARYPDHKGATASPQRG